MINFFLQLFSTTEILTNSSNYNVNLNLHIFTFENPDNKIAEKLNIQRNKFKCK